MASDNEDFIEHIKQEVQTKKVKNPWLGAFLALIFGPFGFIYYSWKVAVGWFVGLSIVVLFSIVVFDYDLPAWSKYIVLPIMAAYAYFDIKWWNSAVAHWKK